MNVNEELSVRELICDFFPDDTFLFADGFDEAIIGVCTKTFRIVYARSKCIDILSKDMSFDEAEEYFDYNVEGSYVGEQTPIFVEDGFLINT